VVAVVGVLIPLSNLLLPEGSCSTCRTYLMALFENMSATPSGARDSI